MEIKCSYAEVLKILKTPKSLLKYPFFIKMPHMERYLYGSTHQALKGYGSGVHFIFSAIKLLCDGVMSCSSLGMYVVEP